MSDEMNNLKVVAIDHLSYLIRQAHICIEEIEGLQEKCEACDGSGEEGCDFCGEAGEEACDECDGEGYLYDDDDPDYEQECTECNGMGYIDCDECGGDGSIPCYDCNGDGQRDDDLLDQDIVRLVRLVDDEWK